MAAYSASAEHVLRDEFRDRVCIVTGTSGIGKAIAQRLAWASGVVLVCGIDEACNEKLAHEAKADGLNINICKCDVSDPNAVERAVKMAVKQFGGLDVIVNAAAIHPFGTAEETSLETWNKCLMVNVTSVFLFAHHGIPELRKRGGGAVINLASVQGHACQRGVVAYVASKGAIHSLTRALALDHARDGVRVNSISPGSIATPMLELAAVTFSPELPVKDVFQRFGEAHPLGRVGSAEEVADWQPSWHPRVRAFVRGLITSSMVDLWPA